MSALGYYAGISQVAHAVCIQNAKKYHTATISLHAIYGILPLLYYRYKWGTVPKLMYNTLVTLFRH